MATLGGVSWAFVSAERFSVVMLLVALGGSVVLAHLVVNASTVASTSRLATIVFGHRKENYNWQGRENKSFSNFNI